MSIEDVSVADALVVSMVDINRPGFLMSTVRGTDVVARTVKETGWWSFEQPLPAVMVSIIQKWPGLVLDIGANTGFYSLLLTAAHPATTVIAFEPDPVVLTKLRQNLAINALSARVTVKPFGLSNVSGESTLFIPLQNHGHVETSSSLDRGFKAQHSEEVQVVISTLDEALPACEAISLVKIDVEGHEMEALQGAEATFARLRPIIAIELLDRADYSFFNDWKARHNYSSFALRFSSAVLEQEMAFDPAAWNHALVPAEKVDEFVRLLEVLEIHLV